MKLIFILALFLQAIAITCDAPQDGGLYMIFPKGSGKVLGIDGASTDVGAEVVAEALTCDDSQKFTLKQYDASSFTVVVKSSGLVLTANGASASDFSYLYQREENHGVFYQEIAFVPGPDGYYFIRMSPSNTEDYTLNIDGHSLTFEPVTGADNQLFWLQTTSTTTNQCKDCVAPQVYNPTTYACENCVAPAVYIAATQSCGTCSAPQVYNPTTYACENCVAPEVYLAATQSCGTCSAPQVYNSNNYACENCVAPEVYLAATQACGTCTAPQVYNQNNYACENCVAPEVYLAATKNCGTCSAPQVYNPNAYDCENCPAGDSYNFDGTCIPDCECPNYLRDEQGGFPICKFPCFKTQVYQPVTHKCQCSCSSPFTKETIYGYQVCVLL